MLGEVQPAAFASMGHDRQKVGLRRMQNLTWKDKFSESAPVRTVAPRCTAFCLPDGLIASFKIVCGQRARKMHVQRCALNWQAIGELLRWAFCLTNAGSRCSS